MPSARDLMQKADALMRSNRNLGAGESDHDIPVLTDVVIAGDTTILRQPQAATPTQWPPAQSSPHSPSHPPTHLESAQSQIRPQGDPLRSGVLSDESRSLADQLAKEQARRESDKRELAEAVYFEVLRDLDVDSGDEMRERLSAELGPVFEQMASDLVIRAEHALSEAIRQQVAAAIERKLGVPPRSARDE